MDTLSNSHPNIIPWEYNAEDGHYHPHNASHHRVHHCHNYALNDSNTTDEADVAHTAPYSILFLFGVFAIGAIVRFLLKHLRLPYTVVLFVLGVLFGLAANHYEPLQHYTELANMSPHLILYIFLPILIFESAFAMDTHTFFRCSVQCLILAVPGLLISTALTAVLSVNLFLAYDWGWPTALLFGSILSATDPVAVVALLREIGTSKTLSTLVEGESLLNDGSAIVAYSVLIELVVPGTDIDASSILIKFCQISLGGPALGYVMGKISVFCLSRVFNDAMIEITITLSSAYITYYLAEAVLKVSGVLALVALGVVISGEKDSISPEVEVFVHKFWENLSYLANTVIFIVVGIVVADAGADFIEKQDWFLICATYVGSTVFRFMMIGILSPALSRLGYGLRWQDAVIMTWGGLRGAVGLALALLVSEQEGIDKEKVGHKILIHVSGIVLLTLLVNATTIKPLLSVLGMSEISNWKRRNMAVAVRHLHDIQGRSIHVQKNNQFLADADWKHVEMITTINNPFSVRKQTKEETEDEENDCDSDSASYAILRYSSCPDCELQHVISPNQKELEDMFNEARLRMISAQKVSYWRQFENGLLAQENVRVLLSAADVAADKDKSFVTVEDLRTHWKIPFIYDWLERQLREQVPRKMSQESSEASDLNSVTTTCPHNLRQFIRHPYFDYTVYIIISLSVIFLGLEAAFRIHKSIREDHPIICETLQIINYVFFVLYLVEITLKMVRFTCKRYWRVKWNQFDVVMLLFYVADLVTHFVADYGLPKDSHEQDILILVYCGIRLVRVLRILRLLKLVRHRLLAILDTVINSYLNAGYDIGCGFLVGEEEVMKMIEDIVDYQPIVKELQSICEQNRNQIIRELAQLQEKHSSVAVAVKTRHAARSILNNSRDELNELKEKGLLDDGVYEQLMDAIEKQMKRLVNSPTSMLPAPPIELLRNVEWIADCDDIFNFIKNRATVVKFPKGKLLYSCGDQPSGIYIITVGIIKIEGHIVDMDGELPNTDSFHWFSSQDYFEDCLTAANVLGELGSLSKKPMNTNAICETEVQAFHIAQDAMERAFTTFKEHPSIEYKMWRTCALRIAKTVLKNNPQYVDWSTGRIMMHLQRALLPDLRGLTSFTLESEMQDVILIQGRAKDPNTGEIYRGVAYIPRTVYTLGFENYDEVRPILLIVGSLDITSGSAGQHNQMEWADRRQRWSICPPAPSRCLLHQVRRRSAVPAGSRRSSRARASTSRGSRGSWVEGLPEFFHPRTYSQPIDLQDEKPKSRTTLKPDVTVTVADPIPGEISISVPAGVVARRRSTLDLPFAETSDM